MGSLLKMKFFSVLWLWMFLSEFKTSTTGEIPGYIGRHVIISCSHIMASNNIKYFCRDPCGYGDVLVQSDRSPEGRYKLEDSGTGTFTVTIADLQESDSGVYYCGVQRFGFDTYQRVHVTVDNTKNLEEATHLKTTETQTNPWTGAEIRPTTPRHSVSTSSSTKDSAHSLTSTGFVKSSGPAGKHAVPVHFILYASAGLVVTLIISSVGLVTCQWRKRVKQSRYFTATSTSIYNERHNEAATGVYAHAPDDRSYAAIQKSSIKSKSQSDPIYQNLHFNTNQGEAIYGNI
ncbi:CMRF35-like molecule 1 [Pimephales promelas]|uniref:CMRF35-like molecule 1 n=1 Tax=Pimephales promelas TaxID=90988 RepID=UPI001955F3A8|nr:CMRF35-like molecule 1 [Pimephales promelas]